MKFKVSVHCITYNHSAFIEDAMNGFCSQDTSFPFVCVIVDDASTDGEVGIISQYIQDHFDTTDTLISKSVETKDYGFIFSRHKTNKNCYFAFYSLHFNHFQTKKSKDIYFKDWSDSSQYIAWCEGDDYWINSDKLQRQVSFLDNHSSYSMTCNRTYLYSVRKNRIVGENYCYNKSKTVSLKDVIYRTGLFISTCSIVYRREISANKPDYWKNCLVGDYPLQIACAMNGDVWYFNDVMAVYRIDNSSSWMGSKNWGSGTSPFILMLIQSSLLMFEGFANDFPGYYQLFKNKKAEEINRNVPSSRVCSSQEVESFLANFDDEISHYSLRWKIDLFFRKCRCIYIRILYERVFTRRYQAKNKWYTDNTYPSLR